MELSMISERGINLHCYPIENVKSGYYKDDIERYTDSFNGVPVIDFIAQKDSRWSHKCYYFMDYIASRLYYTFSARFSNKHCRDLHTISKNNKILINELPLLVDPKPKFEIINKIFTGQHCTDYEKDSIKNYLVNIKITAKELRRTKQFPCKSEIEKVVNMINGYKIKTKYKILSLKNKEGEYCFNQGYSNMEKDFESIAQITKVDQDLYVEFKSLLGVCFLHNVFSGGYQLHNKKFESLSKYAKVFYRRKFLIYGNKRRYKCTIDLNSFNNITGLTNKNITYSTARFKKIMDELIEKGLLTLVEKSNRSYSVFKNNKKH